MPIEVPEDIPEPQGTTLPAPPLRLREIRHPSVASIPHFHAITDTFDDRVIFYKFPASPKPHTVFLCFPDSFRAELRLLPCNRFTDILSRIIFSERGRSKQKIRQEHPENEKEGDEETDEGICSFATGM